MEATYPASAFTFTHLGVSSCAPRDRGSQNNTAMIRR